MAMVFRQKLGEGRRYQTGNVSPEVQEREARAFMQSFRPIKALKNRYCDPHREVKSIFHGGGYDLDLCI